MPYIDSHVHIWTDDYQTYPFAEAGDPADEDQMTRLAAQRVYGFRVYPTLLSPTTAAPSLGLARASATVLRQPLSEFLSRRGPHRRLGNLVCRPTGVCRTLSPLARPPAGPEQSGWSIQSSGTKPRQRARGLYETATRDRERE